MSGLPAFADAGGRGDVAALIGYLDAYRALPLAQAAAGRLRFAADVEQIVSAAGVTMGQVRGSSRTAALVQVRRIIATYLRRRGSSLPEIGRLLNRDHASVLHLPRSTGWEARRA